MFTARITAVQVDNQFERILDENGNETGRHMNVVRADIRVCYVDCDGKPTTRELGKYVTEDEARGLVNLCLTSEKVLLQMCGEDWLIIICEEME